MPLFVASLIWILAVLAIVAVILWGLTQVPGDSTIKTIARVVVIVAASIWVIYMVAGMLVDLPPLPHR